MIDWLSLQLTIENPIFLEAVKRGRYTGKIPQFIKLYRPIPEGIVVPRGYLQLLEEILIGKGLDLEIQDNRILLKPVDFDFSKTLVPYQEMARRNMLSHSNGMLIAPAASGKTIIGLNIIATVRQPALWLTHTKRLAGQVIERCIGTDEFEPVFPGMTKKEIGLIGIGKDSIGDRLTIGIIASLIRREDLLTLGKRFGTVILDECLIANSKVLLLDGSIKDIENIVDGDITTFGKVTTKFARKTRELVKLSGSFGQLVGTLAHQLPYVPYNKLIKDKKTNYFRKLSEEDVVFGKLEDIQPNDFLLVAENFCHTAKYNIGKEKSRLLALIACDGHIEKHLYCAQVGVTKDKEWFLNEMISDTSFAKNPDIRISDCRRGDLIIRSYSDEIIGYLNKYIPEGNKSRVVEVPDMMTYASMEDLANFLQIVFDTEGSVTDQITLTMTSHNFVNDIAYLLRKFGIVARIVPIKHKDMLRLAMSGYDAFLFWKKIGFSIPRKQALLEEMMRKTAIWRRVVKYKGVIYRCMPVVHKEIYNDLTEVHDFTTDDHLFLVNGVLSSNCHHAPASTFTKVLTFMSSFYMYGLTATPYRRDKLEELMFATIGQGNAIILRKEVQDEGRIVTPSVVKRDVTMPVVDSNDYHQIIHGLVMADQNRKNLIATDVFREARRGNCCIVISTIKVYCEDLYAMISQYWPKTAIATGDYSDKHNNAQVKKIENGEATVLITTFELLGEGFDVPKLNRAFLALPFRERARVEQMVGRIQRTAPNKDDAIIYDYVDSNIGILNDQYRARKAVYKSLGMTILEDD